MTRRKHDDNEQLPVKEPESGAGDTPALPTESGAGDTPALQIDSYEMAVLLSIPARDAERSYAVGEVLLHLDDASMTRLVQLGHAEYYTGDIEERDGRYYPAHA